VKNSLQSFCAKLISDPFEIGGINTRFVIGFDALANVLKWLKPFKSAFLEMFNIK